MYRIDLACLKEIARGSRSPKSSEPAEKNDDVKLTNVREDQPVFYTTQVESEWQRRIFFVRLAMENPDGSPKFIASMLVAAVGAGKIFAQLDQSCRWSGGIFRVDKQSILQSASSSRE